MIKDEYNAIFNMMRQKLIVIPPECVIIRLKDVMDAMDCFLEPRKIKGEPND